MTRVERSIVIEKPVEDVWEFVHDTTKDALWQTTLVESQQLTDGPIDVGTTVREVRNFLGRRVEMTWQMTECKRNRRSSIQAVAGPVPLSGRYEFEPVGSATKLTVTGELDAHRLFKLAEPIFRQITARELEANLGHLKDLVESWQEAS
jgi:uncharacterized membrane protein